MLSFDESMVVFNPLNNTFTILALASWMQPTRSNGDITSYSVKIVLGDRDVTVYFNDSVSSSEMNLNVTVTVEPYQEYYAVISVSNGAGSTDANTSSVFSPQAGESLTNLK